MITHEFRKINKADIPAMANLLLARQDLECEVFPFLKNSCLNEKYIRSKLETLFINSETIGFGALVKGELVGYIMATIKIHNSKGRYAFIPYEGVAIKADQSSELIKYLYGKVSLLWVQQGCFEHVVNVPIGQTAYYEAFIHLSFAMEHVHAVMQLKDYKPFEYAIDEKVRLVNKEDRESLGRMSGIIAEFHNAAPVFVPTYPEVLERRKEAFKELVDEDDIVLIAEKDQKEVGFLVFESITPHLMSPDDAIELSVAGTYSSQMGRGIGKKLMDEGYQIIKEKGYGSIITDWKITNLASSSFWPKCGFKPVVYSMTRYIDPDYAWANFSNPLIRVR